MTDPHATRARIRELLKKHPRVAQFPLMRADIEELLAVRAPAEPSELPASDLDIVLVDLRIAVEKALAKHAPMRGAHEGYAVILEELDELWDEVKRQTVDPAEMRKEALHVAAMGVRFLLDVCAVVPAPAPSRAPEPESRETAFAVLQVFDRWRKELPLSGFTHDQGLQFVRMIQERFAPSSGVVPWPAPLTTASNHQPSPLHVPSCVPSRAPERCGAINCKGDHVPAQIAIRNPQSLTTEGADLKRKIEEMPSYRVVHGRLIVRTDGEWLYRSDVLAALLAAQTPVPAEEA